MGEFLQNGLSGWIVTFVVLFFGGGITFRIVTRRKSQQSNIRAGGDVAGGDIIKGEKQVPDGDVSSKDVSVSEQKDIKAGGDVAGGNIFKGEK